MRHRNDKWEREMERESSDWDTQLKSEKNNEIGNRRANGVFGSQLYVPTVCVHNYIWVSKDHSHTTGSICVHACVCLSICVRVCVCACVCAFRCVRVYSCVFFCDHQSSK